MRNLINKLTLLESTGRLSIETLSKCFKLTELDKGSIEFKYQSPLLDQPVNIEGKDFKIITFSLSYSLLKEDDDGNLKYKYRSNSINILSLFHCIVVVKPILNFDKHKEQTIKAVYGTVVEMIKEMFGVEVQLSQNVHYSDNKLSRFSIFQITFPNSPELLEVLNDAYQYRQERL